MIDRFMLVSIVMKFAAPYLLYGQHMVNVKVVYGVSNDSDSDSFPTVMKYEYPHFIFNHLAFNPPSTAERECWSIRQIICKRQSHIWLIQQILCMIVLTSLAIESWSHIHRKLNRAPPPPALPRSKKERKFLLCCAVMTTQFHMSGRSDGAYPLLLLLLSPFVILS